MIINKIRLQEEFPMFSESDSWPLPICDLNLNSSAGENGYILKQVEGLEPPDLSEIVEGFDIYGTPSIIDVPDKRHLAFKIGLNPKVGQSYGELRDVLYRFISRSVLIRLMNDGIVLAETKGHIHKFEADLFSNRPEVEITIECKDGALFGPIDIGIPTATLNTTDPVINYQEGSAPTGLDLKFNVTASVSGFSITNYGRVHRLTAVPISNKFELTYPLVSGDQITLSTQPGSRRLTLLRSSVVTDLAGYINIGAVWPLLYPGVNTMTWTLGSSWLSWVTATYRPRFWGV